MIRAPQLRRCLLAPAQAVALLFATPFLVAHSPKAAQSATVGPQPRVIEVTADHDSQYRIHGQTRQVITVTAGEPLVLRITAIKAKSHNRDGAVHGFSLLHEKSRQLVPGWDFLLHPGMNEFSATAHTEPGDYEVVCTVICSDDHEQMSMKFVVLPSGG
jgi:heme/copper-type cytochrome/quinol oxidase subunit 2